MKGQNNAFVPELLQSLLINKTGLLKFGSDWTPQAFRALMPGAASLSDLIDLWGGHKGI